LVGTLALEWVNQHWLYELAYSNGIDILWELAYDIFVWWSILLLDSALSDC